MRRIKPKPGEWYAVPLGGKQDQVCCDCALVHTVEVRVIVDKKTSLLQLQQRMWRNERRTRAERKKRRTK